MARGADAIIVCARGAAVQAGVLEGAELLASARLADVLFVAVGTVRYGARYTCCSGSVGLLAFCACITRDCGISLRARLASVYAPVCCIVAEGADFYLASFVSGGEVSTASFAIFLTNARARIKIGIFLPIGISLWLTRSALCCCALACLTVSCAWSTSDIFC